MADFSQVQAIQTLSLDDGKGVLQLRIAGATEPLTITCASLAEAEDMADLIDGYCRLVHDFQGSFWTKKGNSLVCDTVCIYVLITEAHLLAYYGVCYLSSCTEIFLDRIYYYPAKLL